MKPNKKLMITKLVLFTAMTSIFAVQAEPEKKEETIIQLRCSAELTELAKSLAEQYQQENAGMDIRVATIFEETTINGLESGEIALVNKDCLSTVGGEQGKRVVVGRNVIVPIMNINHPQKELILQKGISPVQFATIYKSSDQISWGQLLESENQNPVVAYMPGTRCSKDYLARFLDASPVEIKAKEVTTPEEMIRKIESDPNALGFCTLACLTNREQEGKKTGISLVPIDMDGNGAVEWFEDIYGTNAKLSHGIFVGKYPRELYSRIYAVSSKGALSEKESAFLEWIITDGQETLASANILKLDYSEKASGLQNLYPSKGAVLDVPVKATSTRTALLIMGGLIVLVILTWVYGRKPGIRHGISGPGHSSEPGIFKIETSSNPAGLFFDRSHTWAFMEKTGEVRIGLDNFIQKVTGSVSRVVMKTPGENITRGDTLFTIVQQGKQLEIKSPVTGVIIEQNEALLDDSALLNQEPYSAGWVYLVEPLNWMNEIKSCFRGESYGKWLKSELTRLKDFFAAGLSFKGETNPALVLQDGGEIREGVLEMFGPEVWEDFQSNFINRNS